MNNDKNSCCCGNENHEHNHKNHGQNDCGCNHEEGSCGCGHEHQHDSCECGHEHDDYQMINLTLEDGSEMKCHVLGSFEVENKSYIALLPEEDENVILYEYEEIGENEIDLINIETEEEFAKISQVFNEIFVDEEDDE